MPEIPHVHTLDKCLATSFEELSHKSTSTNNSTISSSTYYLFSCPSVVQNNEAIKHDESDAEDCHNNRIILINNDGHSSEGGDKDMLINELNFSIKELKEVNLKLANENSQLQKNLENVLEDLIEKQGTGAAATTHQKEVLTQKAEPSIHNFHPLISQTLREHMELLFESNNNYHHRSIKNNMISFKLVVPNNWDILHNSIFFKD